MSLNANYFPTNDWQNQPSVIDSIAANNQLPIKNTSDQLMSQLVAEQVRRVDDKSGKNWIKDNFNNPITLTISSFVISLLLLVLLEPSFVRKKKLDIHENGGEYELEKSKVSFAKVLLISILVSLLVYGTPLIYMQYKKNQSS